MSNSCLQMQNYKVSIIVPVYNIEMYIPKCVDSLLIQDYQNIEIILVDDGSKDSSGKLCDEYSKLNQRITVIHKENGGLSDARNTGVKAATGDYVLFLDGDDYVEKDYVSSLVTSLTKYNATMACSPLIFEYANGIKIESRSFNERKVTKEEMINIVFRARYSIGVSVCSKLMRVEDVKSHPFPVGKYHEDMITIEDIIMSNNEIVILPYPTYHYVQRNTSITYADVSFDSLNYGLDFLARKAETATSSICRNAYTHRMFGLMNTYCRVIDVKKSSDDLKIVQTKLRKQITQLIKDSESSIGDKIKSVLLSTSIHTFLLLQKTERTYAKRRINRREPNL